MHRVLGWFWRGFAFAFAFWALGSGLRAVGSGLLWALGWALGSGLGWALGSGLLGWAERSGLGSGSLRRTSRPEKHGLRQGCRRPPATTMAKASISEARTGSRASDIC